MHTLSPLCKAGEQFAMLYLRDLRLSPFNRQQTANQRCFAKADLLPFLRFLKRVPVSFIKWWNAFQEQCSTERVFKASTKVFEDLRRQIFSSVALSYVSKIICQKNLLQSGMHSNPWNTKVGWFKSYCLYISSTRIKLYLK